MKKPQKTDPKTEIVSEETDFDDVVSALLQVPKENIKKPIPKPKKK